MPSEDRTQQVSTAAFRARGMMGLSMSICLCAMMREFESLTAVGGDGKSERRAARGAILCVRQTK